MTVPRNIFIRHVVCRNFYNFPYLLTSLSKAAAFNATGDVQKWRSNLILGGGGERWLEGKLWQHSMQQKATKSDCNLHVLYYYQVVDFWQNIIASIVIEWTELNQVWISRRREKGWVTEWTWKKWKQMKTKKLNKRRKRRNPQERPVETFKFPLAFRPEGGLM